MANLEQFPSAALNGAYYDTPVAFEPQLPMGRPAGTNPFADSDTVVPPGAVLLEGGKLRLNFLAPTAAKVDAVLRYRERHDLEKGENGLWTAEIDAGDGGFIPILFHVDGVEVLNPLAPVGYGSSRPINYVDVPQPGVDTRCSTSSTATGKTRSAGSTRAGPTSFWITSSPRAKCPPAWW